MGVLMSAFLILTAAAAQAQTIDELPALLAEQINCGSLSDDSTLSAYATEMAAGVTAEREAEIAEALPAPYVARVQANAQVDGETLQVPRIVRATFSRAAEGTPWQMSASGRRQGRAKADCVIGADVSFMSADAAVINAVVLWRRER